jgi:hypothetical protein
MPRQSITSDAPLRHDRAEHCHPPVVLTGFYRLAPLFRVEAQGARSERRNI